MAGRPGRKAVGEPTRAAETGVAMSCAPRREMPRPRATGFGTRERCAGAERLVGEGARDVGAGADLALEVALGEELVEGGHDGVAGDAELAGHGAGGGEAGAGGQAAGEDGEAQAVVELAVQGFVRLGIQCQCGWDSFCDHGCTFQRSAISGQAS